MSVLSEEYLAYRFHSRIVPMMCQTAKSTDVPVSIFLGGQPGAGKTQAQRNVLSLYEANSVLPVIGDDLRQFHPDYLQLMRENPLQMPDITAHASGTWTGMLVRWTDENHVSNLIEGTWRNSSTVLDEAQYARSLGRKTHAVIVAVPPALSLLSTAQRFYFDYEKNGVARWTPPFAHDITVRNLTDNVPAIAASGLFNRLSVIDRQGILHYDGTDADMFSHAWKQEFTRSLTSEEHDHAVSVLAKLKELANRYTPNHEEAWHMLDRLEHEVNEHKDYDSILATLLSMDGANDASQGMTL